MMYKMECSFLLAGPRMAPLLDKVPTSAHKCPQRGPGEASDAQTALKCIPGCHKKVQKSKFEEDHLLSPVSNVFVLFANYSLCCLFAFHAYGLHISSIETDSN